MQSHISTSAKALVMQATDSFRNMYKTCKPAPASLCNRQLQSTGMSTLWPMRVKLLYADLLSLRSVNCGREAEGACAALDGEEGRGVRNTCCLTRCWSSYPQNGGPYGIHLRSV